ncbi:MAG: hypothetical protein LBK26_02550 [Rickettsiales bacterium]|jgi:hypothetical protein|nr:hypothetical protein [Rickettsiales bacterium]
MKFIKNNVKFIIGILVLGLVATVFFISMKPQDLETGDLRAWVSAPSSRRGVAVEILTGSRDNISLMVACIDKMSALPDSGNVKVRDAASLCAVGIALKANK